MKWIELRSMCYKNTCARRQQIAEAMRIMKKNSAEFGCDHIESWDNQGNVSSDGRR
jgi:hypothetical protein